jgi:hypothetical protein
MSSNTARQEILSTLLAEKWVIKQDEHTISASSPHPSRRKISVAFHERGSVILGYTIQPKPFNKGTQVQALPLPRRAAALKFIRGEQA